MSLPQPVVIQLLRDALARGRVSLSADEQNALSQLGDTFAHDTFDTTEVQALIAAAGDVINAGTAVVEAIEAEGLASEAALTAVTALSDAVQAVIDGFAEAEGLEDMTAVVGALASPKAALTSAALSLGSATSMLESAGATLESTEATLETAANIETE